MKVFLQKLILWLPVGFLALAVVDALLLHDTLYQARHSDIQMYALSWLAVSFLVGFVAANLGTLPRDGYGMIYRWYLGVPLLFMLVVLALGSMAR